MSHIEKLDFSYKNSPEIQERRSDLTLEISKIREERDETRRKAKKTTAKIRGIIGIKEGSGDLSKKADELQEKAKEALCQGKSQIAAKIKELEQKRQKAEQEKQFASDLSEVYDTINSFMVQNERYRWEEPSPASLEKMHSEKESIIQKRDILLSSLDQEQYAKNTLEDLGRMIEAGFYVDKKTTPGSYCWEIAEFAANLVHTKLGWIGRYLHSANIDLVRSSIRTIKSLLCPKYEALEGDIVATIQKFISPEMIRVGLNNENNYHCRDVATQELELLLGFGEQEKREQCWQIILSMMEAKEENQRTDIPRRFYYIIDVLCHSRYGEAEKTGKYFLKEVIENYGLDFQKIYEAWRDGCLDFAWSLHTIEVLEHQRPGIVRALHQEFNLSAFGRYSPEFLLRQYKQRNDQNLPYGVIIYPQADHNSAFTRSKYIIRDLLKATENQIALRVFECKTKVEVVRTLIRIAKKYNPEGREERKIAFAIIGGHGSPQGISFGYWKYGELIKSDLMGQGAKKASKFFQKDSTIILESCSTGVPQGIGQILSEKLGLKVIAPETPTALSNVNAEIENGKIKLVVKYASDVKKAYQSGVPLLDEDGQERDI